MTIRPSFITPYGPAFVAEDRYADGALAVRLIDGQGPPMTTLSTNIPPQSRRLPPNCFYMKTWSENQELAVAAMDSGLFRPRDDLPTAASGFVRASVWEIVRKESP